MNEIFALLKTEYGIAAKSIISVKGGFSAKAAYRVVGTDGIEYFLKVYDKSLPTTRYFIDRIDTYMPLLSKLSALPALHGRVLTPIPLRNGAYKAETADSVYVLFLFVHGETPGIQGVTRTQTVELAEILALLHDAGKAVPYETPGLAEDITLPFCDRLAQYLKRTDREHNALFDLVSPHTELLLNAISETQRLCYTVRTGYSPLVLCHGDAHGNNLIQGERLVLADWEDIHIAPVEADLFIYAWYPNGDTLLKAYTNARNGYQINRELLHFYVLRRRIEDIWVDIQRITEEAPDEAEEVELLNRTRLGIENIQVLYRDSTV